MNGLEEQQLVLFSLILMRISGCIFLNPVFRRTEVPASVRAGLSFLLTLMLFPMSSAEEVEVTSSIVFGMLLLREFAVGWILGFVMELFLMVVSAAGAVIDFQMGLSMATVYDAGSNIQNALSGTFLSIYFFLIFFAADGHLAMLKVFLTSADILPYGGTLQLADISSAMITLFAGCFEMALRMAIPMIVIEFVGEMAIGILMKVIPQINLFILSIQIKIMIGLLVFLFLVSPLGDFMGNIITQMLDTMIQLLNLA